LVLGAWFWARVRGIMASVISVVVIVIVLVIAIPVGVLVSGAAAAAILGWFVKDDVEDRFEGSEHLEMGR
jgi:hypothetical protein